MGALLSPGFACRDCESAYHRRHSSARLLGAGMPHFCHGNLQPRAGIGFVNRVPVRLSSNLHIPSCRKVQRASCPYWRAGVDRRRLGVCARSADKADMSEESLVSGSESISDFPEGRISPEPPMSSLHVSQQARAAPHSAAGGAKQLYPVVVNSM